MGSAAADEIATERVRLYINPLNPELLNKIIAPSILPQASNISFHTVQTFPERGFGYVELPVMAAQKVKQKLNGSTLKGTKVRIEEAKPERKRKAEEEGYDEVEDDTARKARKLAKKEKKQKREEGVLPGMELEDGRRVKRGWTEDEAKDSKRRKKSDKAVGEANGDGERRLRFKTSLPPNAVPLAEEGKDKSKKKKKDGESKRGKEKTVVQEFGRSKKSRDVSFNLGDNSKRAARYEDGKGWVDEAGEVVEAERPSKKPKRRKHTEDQDTIMEENQAPIAVREVEESRQDQADPEEDEDAEEHDSNSPHDESVENEKDQPMTADNATPPIAKDEQPPPPPVNEVHPLEALFKKPASGGNSAPKPKPGPIDTSFSFFDAGGDQDDEDVGTNQPPQTPHTRRDLEWRSLRSAAPTPDTAAIGRKFSFPFAGDHDEDDDGEDPNDHDDDDVEWRNTQQANSGATRPEDGERGEESGFRKRFYDGRGDFNRGWKKRRRDERKQKRQRDNRRFSQRVA
ncbi:uncharacterized protein LTR77_005644 [Saxophila tyrrhenica]|uniref:RRM domain-containing protein n=1 Tax=Saxophila tyrrhenica TaxID=1690608 RepID=A0AAV9P918_9PEZI|nr:hypothetical protein LTR77_005644 [Saxophila tyrrhenica]